LEYGILFKMLYSYVCIFDINHQCSMNSCSQHAGQGIEFRRTDQSGQFYTGWPKKH